MKKSSILKMPNLLLGAIFILVVLVQCTKKVEQDKKDAADDLRSEKFVLVKYLSSYGVTIRDAYGDTVTTDKYYSYPKMGAALIPVDYLHEMNPLTRTSIDQYLSSLNSLGNLHTDTIDAFLLVGNLKIKLLRYDIRGLSMSPVSFE
jgi:hypothetical protein